MIDASYSVPAAMNPANSPPVGAPAKKPISRNDQRCCKDIERPKGSGARNGQECNPATFDNYLAMLWTLSLAAPVKYLEKHPFDLTGEDEAKPFLITGKRGQAGPSPCRLHGNCVTRQG